MQKAVMILQFTRSDLVESDKSFRVRPPLRDEISEHTTHFPQQRKQRKAKFLSSLFTYWALFVMQILYQIKDDILLYFKYETYDINKLTQKCLL